MRRLVFLLLVGQLARDLLHLFVVQMRHNRIDQRQLHVAQLLSGPIEVFRFRVRAVNPVLERPVELLVDAGRPAQGRTSRPLSVVIGARASGRTEVAQLRATHHLVGGGGGRIEGKLVLIETLCDGIMMVGLNITRGEKFTSCVCVSREE